MISSYLDTVKAPVHAHNQKTRDAIIFARSCRCPAVASLLPPEARRYKAITQSGYSPGPGLEFPLRVEDCRKVPLTVRWRACAP